MQVNQIATAIEELQAVGTTSQSAQSAYRNRAKTSEV